MAKTIKMLVLVCIVAWTGCKQSKSPSGKENEGFDNEVVGHDKENIEQIYHRFPSPEEMLLIFNKNEYEYNYQILNDPQKASQYLNSRDVALNMGIYIADLAYITLFEKHNDASDYFEAIYDLSSVLRISAAFDKQLLRRVQDNISAPDSLKALSDFSFTKISNYLVSSKKEKVFAIISIGGFVEALYLSFQFAGDFSEDNIIIQRIADQKLVLENLLGYTMAFQNDPAVMGAVSAIAPIRAVYNELISEEGKTIVTKTADGKLVVSGGNKIVITAEQYAELKEATISVRKKITQN